MAGLVKKNENIATDVVLARVLYLLYPIEQYRITKGRVYPTFL